MDCPHLPTINGRRGVRPLFSVLIYLLRVFVWQCGFSGFNLPVMGDGMGPPRWGSKFRVLGFEFSFFLDLLLTYVVLGSVADTG